MEAGHLQVSLHTNIPTALSVLLSFVLFCFQLDGAQFNSETSSVRLAYRQVCAVLSWLMVAVEEPSPLWAEHPWASGPGVHQTN